MKELSPEYLGRAENWVFISMLAYFLMNGAQLFETVVVVPKWSAKPPGSLSALQGPYAPDLKTFWIIAHTIHELTFIAAIVFCWQLVSVRNWLLILFALHFAVRLWTLGYFAPNIMAFQKTDLAAVSDHLEKTVRKWRNLNYLRVAAFVLLSFGMVFTYYKTRIQYNSLNLSSKNNFMEQRFTVITLGVDDLKAETAFYKNKLGWTTVAENKDIIFFRMNGFLFSLFERKPLAEGAGVDAAGTGFRSMVIAYNVPAKEDVDKLFRELKAKDVKILKEPSPTPFGGYYFSFADPENNVLEVAFNPYIPLDENGNVITHKSIDNL